MPRLSSCPAVVSPPSSTVEAQLERATQRCQTRGVRLTEARRYILGLILSSKRPIGAYDLLDHFRQVQPNAAPPTVYRALSFLLDQGLIHRLERLAAFVGCTHVAVCDDGCASVAGEVTHRAQFMICHVCGRAREMEQEAIVPALMIAAQNIGFTVETATIEIEGVCADCRQDQERTS